MRKVGMLAVLLTAIVVLSASTTGVGVVAITSAADSHGSSSDAIDVTSAADDRGSNKTLDENATGVDGTDRIKQSMYDSGMDVKPVNNSTSGRITQQQVGDTIQFFTRTNNGFTQTSGVVERVTPTVEIIVENGVQNNQNITQQEVDQVAEVFEQKIQPQANNQYGTSNDIDGDGRIAIYLLDIRLESDTDNDGTIDVFTAGYHDPVDYINNPNSNNRNGIYMDIVQGDPGTRAFNTTMTQEYVHAVNYNLDPNEEIWLDEAVANYAEYSVLGDKNQGRISGTPGFPGFEDRPDTSLTGWNPQPNPNPDYGASFIFGAYLADHYGGPSTLSNVISAQGQGRDSVTQGLQNSGHNVGFDRVFEDWTVANRINDDSIDQYGYSDFNIEVDAQQTSVGSSGQTLQDLTNRTAADYYTISTNLEAIYYELSANPDISADLVVESQSSTGVYFRSLGNGSANETTIREQLPDAANESATQSRNIFSTPPVSFGDAVINANEYDEITIVVQNSGANDGSHDLEIDSVPSNNRYNIELDQNESATYAIPVNVYGTPNLGSTYEYNGFPYVGVWSDDSTTVSANLSGPGAGKISPPNVNAVELYSFSTGLLSVGSTYNLTINGPPEGPSRVNVTTNYLEGGLNSDQVFGLPSSSSIQFASNGDRVAGDPSNPGPVEFDVLIETADDPYVYSPFDAPDKSHFDVTVNGTTIPDSQIVLTEKRQNRYQIRFVPPTQQTAGQYNITVEFNDTKLGVERAVTANDTIQYTTGGGSAGAAATAIIIDDSGSMSGFTTPTKLDDAKDAGKQYVSQLGPSDYAAVIGFDFDAEVATPMIRATPSNKSRLNSGVDSLVGGGGTDIGAGLDAGFTELSNAPGSTQKAAVLLSDGRAPFPQSVVDKYNNSNIPVYTIALGSGADEADLKQIAAETGGQFYKEPTSSNLQDLYAQISQQVSGQSTISSKSGSVPAQSQTSNKLSVDSSTDSTTLRVSVGGSSPRTNATSALQSATVRLQYPNGTFVQLNSSTPTGTENSNITYSTVGDSVTYRINSPITGDWSYVIENTQSSGSLDYDAKATASTSTTVSVSTDTNTYVKGSTTTVTASVVNGSGGLSGATVVANITAPDGTHQITTLTEDSAGSYTTTLSAAQTGTYTAQINVTRGNVQREKSLTWDVVSQSAVAQVNRVNTTTPSVAQGGTASQTYNISQGTAGSPRAITTTGTITGEEFTYQVREIAASPPGTYDTDEFSEAALKAAQVYRNLSEADARSVFSAKGHVSGFVRVGELQTASGATISASQTSASKATVTVPQSGNETVTVTVDLPDTAAAGTYNGTVELIVSGTVISANISVTVTNVSESDYRSRIQSEVSPWQTASPSGKRAYEERIAGHLTDLYYNQSAVSRAQTQSDARAGTTFTYNSSGGPTGDVDLSSGDVYNHTVAVETNASDGPVEIVLYYPASSGIDVESVDATFAGSTVTVVNETTTVTINGKQMTRHRFVYRDPADVGTATFELTVGLETPERGQQVTLETGGVHAPSATTLTREQTSMNITHPLDEAVDTDNDGTIGNFEILDAINLWRTQNTVPDTQGKTIGNFEILNLINKWRDQTAV